MDGGEGWGCAGGFGDVVEADHGEVFWYGEAEATGCFDSAEGELIAERQDRRRSRIAREEGFCGDPALLWHVLGAFVDWHVGPGEACVGDGCGVAVKPGTAHAIGGAFLAAKIRDPVAHPGPEPERHDAETPVAELDQVFRSGASRGLVVYAHDRHLIEPWLIHKHSRQT